MSWEKILKLLIANYQVSQDLYFSVSMAKKTPPSHLTEHLKYLSSTSSFAVPQHLPDSMLQETLQTSIN